MIMAIKISYYDVLRVNKSIFMKNSNCSICLYNTFWDEIKYEDHEFHHNESLSLTYGVNKSIFIKNSTRSIDIENT